MINQNRIAIIQPNYIPWIGYFEIIKNVDKFILLDDVQYTKRDWRNRNYINNNGNKLLLTIPIKTKGLFNQNINEVKILNNNWKNEHLKKIFFCYKKTNYFEETYEYFKELYNQIESDNLSEILCFLTKELCIFLKIGTKIKLSSKIKIDGEKNQKIIKICNHFSATSYLSGPKALNYLDGNIFSANKTKLLIAEYQKQDCYIESKYFKFLQKMSIVDLMFHQGKQSKNYIKSIITRELT
jgi:hypothetical protein